MVGLRYSQMVRQLIINQSNMGSNPVIDAKNAKTAPLTGD
jgi:hypothetical protein